MIWLSWRQHRIELLITLALGLCLAAAMTVVGFQAQSGFAAVLHACNPVVGPQCQSTSVNFDSQFSTIFTVFEGALLALPGLAGIFIGAPLLAREFEQGTARLVWTQGITRRRWLATKLGVILASAALVGGLLAVVGAFTNGSATGTTASRWPSFDLQGPVLVAYVVFAIALGTATGALIRRVVPAMGVTMVVFAAVRLCVALLLRPNFLPPLQVELSQPAPDTVGAWNLGERIVDLSGNPVSQQRFNQLMQNAGALPGSVGDYLRAHGVVEYVLYQPESRFWIFQSIEATLFLILAAGLIGLAVWSTRRA